MIIYAFLIIVLVDIPAVNREWLNGDLVRREKWSKSATTGQNNRPSQNLQNDKNRQRPENMPHARFGPNYQILVMVVKIWSILAEDEDDFGIQI